jgi:ABC-type transport system substrate-binding protein
MNQGVMMKKGLIWSFILFFSLSLFSNQGKHALRIGIHNFPLSLNPVYVTDEISQAVINKVFDSLYYFDESGEIRSGLVEKTLLNPNGKIVVMRLQANRFFSDGKELDAEILNEKLATWKNQMTFKILHSGQIKKVNPATFKNSLLSGTGPYKFGRIKEPSLIELTRNTYDLTELLFPVIEYTVVTSTVMKPLKLLNDEIDICELQPEDTQAYRRISQWRQKFSILRYKKFGFTYLVFNLNHSKLGKNLRRVIYNCLINGDFLQKFLKHSGHIVKTPFLLLDEEADKNPLPVVELENPIKLKILSNSESKIRKEFVLFFKQALKSKNVILEPVFLEYQVFLDYLKKGYFDLAVSGFLLDIDYDMKDVFYGGSYFNYSGFKNEKMDELLDQGLKELDPEKRRGIYLQANRIWKDELPLIPLFNLYYYMGISKQIRIPANVCTLMGSTGDFLINIQDWKVR